MKEGCTMLPGPARLFRPARYSVILLLSLAALISAQEADEPAPKTGTAEARFGLTFEPVQFMPPPVHHLTFENGIMFYHRPERTIPLVTVLVGIRAGSVNDPPGKVGLASLTAEVLRTGGSAALDGDALDVALESRGAQLSAESDEEMTWIRLSVLPEDAEWGLGVLRDLLTAPAFPQPRLEEAASRFAVALRQRLDVPMNVAQALFPQLVYGKGNPWGWTATEATLAAITPADLHAFHERFYTAGNLRAAVIGDLDREEAERLMRSTLGQLPAEPAPEIDLPAVEPVQSSRVYIVPRDVTQNVIYFGHEGIGRFDERKFAAKVLNSVLAGGFTSRLFKEVRSNRGLAYSVFGRLGEGTVAGLYFNVAMTRVEATSETLGLMLDINEALTQAPPSAEETQLAIQSDVNAFVFFFDTSEQIVRQAMILDEFGYPEDYLETYVDRLKGVESEQVRQAAAANLHLDRLVVLIVGKVDEDFRRELERIGPITEISDEELRAEWL